MSLNDEYYHLIRACAHGIKCSNPKVKFKIVPGHVMSTKGNGSRAPLIHDLDIEELHALLALTPGRKKNFCVH